MSVVDELREAEQSWRSDDARTWAEALGVLLALGLAVRGGIHVWTALLASRITGEDIDPRLADTDITLQSPVTGLRGHRYDQVARYLTAVAGVGIWTLYTPFGVRPWYSKLVIVTTAAVCIADGVAYLVLVAQKQLTPRTTAHDADQQHSPDSIDMQGNTTSQGGD